LREFAIVSIVGNALGFQKANFALQPRG